MKLIKFTLLALIAVGCQGSGPESETAAKPEASSKPASAANSASSTTESDASEGVVGPDEGFFAGIYLESVFKSSKANPHPALESSIALNSGSVEAFDFAANLQPKRVDLMARIILRAADKDKDGKLSFEEFSALKISPELKGLKGDAVANDFDKELFDAAAGDDNALSKDEIKDLLIKIASQSDLSKMSKAEGKKSLVKSWEEVLKNYDADGDGKLSVDEQNKLRKDRASVLASAAGE